MKLSRRRVAAYLVDGLASQRQERIREVAAWLVAGRRTDEATHLMRDVASLLAEQGYVTATATTARPISAKTRHDMETFIKTTTGAREVELTSEVNEAIKGGVRLQLPDRELDATITTKLHNLVTEMSR